MLKKEMKFVAQLALVWAIFTLGVYNVLGIGTPGIVASPPASVSTMTGLGTGVATALAINVGSAGAPVLQNGALGTPSSGTLTSATGLPVSTGISGLGTNVATALAVNVGSAGAPVVLNGALGTPSSGTLTSATGLPIGTGVSGLGTGVATALAVNTGSAGAPVLFNGAGGTPSSMTGTNITGIVEAGLTLADNTTNNASTSNHGFLKKLSNSATEFMNGAGNWATPAGGISTATAPLVVTGSDVELGTATAPTTADANADVIWDSSATTKKALVLQGLASQTANIFEIQGSNGTSFFAVDVPATTFVGTNATISGTGAMAAATNADNSTIYGAGAGDGITSGDRNSLFGVDAGGSATSGAMSDSSFFGYQTGVATTGSSNSLFGAGITGLTTGQFNTMAGQAITSTAGAGSTVAIGYAANIGGSNGVAIGSSANVTGNNSIAVGVSATTGANASSVAIGAAATSNAANQLVFGGSTFQLTDVYFSEGVTNSSTLAATLNGTGGSGTDNAGGGFNLAAGKGTGTAKGGNVALKRSPSIATGTTAQTLYDGYILVSQGKALTDNTATTVATWTLASGSSGGGSIDYRVQCTDATDYQSVSGTVNVALVNKAGTYTSQASDLTQASALSAGTCAVTWTITAAGAVQVTADTSLTPSGTNAFVIYYTITNNGQGDVTLP